jgi:hypothetical protein
MLFNAGAWMMGAKSFDVLTDVIHGRMAIPTN